MCTYFTKFIFLGTIFYCFCVVLYLFSILYTFENESPEQAIVPLILGTLSGSVGVGEVDLAAPVLNLSKAREL